MNKVFIVGFGRSGTTLLQSILYSQPAVISTPETHFFSNVIYGLAKKNPKMISITDIDTINQRLHQYFRVQFHSQDIRYLEKIAINGSIPTQVLFDRLITSYLKKRNIEIRNTNILVEKTPVHVDHIDEIMTVFPDAKLIGMIRNPINAIVSNQRKLANLNTRSDYYYLAKNWARIAGNFKQLLHERHEKFILIKYEELAKRPAEITRNICSFLHINFSPEALDRYHTKAADLIHDFEVWKNKNLEPIELSKDYKVPFLLRLKLQGIMLDEMKFFGYQPQYQYLTKILVFFYYKTPLKIRREIVSLKR